MAEDLEVLSIGLTLSTEQAAKNIDDFINQAAGRLNDLNQAMATGVQDITDLLATDMEKAVVQVVEEWASGISSMEEGAKRMARLYKLSFDDVLQNAEILQAKLVEITAAYSARAQLGGQMTGAPLSAEQIGVVEQQTAAYYAQALQLGATKDALADFERKTQEFISAIQEVSIYQKVQLQVLDQVKAKYKELGMVLPIQKEKALRDEMNRIVQVGKELGKTTKEINDEMRRAGQNAIPQQQKGISQLSRLFRGLASRIGATAIAYKALQAAQQFFRESIKLAEESIDVTTRLTIAVREHQRAVGELSPTIAETNSRARELSDTYDIELNKTKEILAQSLLLTKSLELSADQTFALSENAIVLGETLGKEPLQVMQQFTNFLNTGYTAGLEQLGFNLDEQSLRVEAINRGYLELGETMDEQTIKMVGMELINERANEVRDDLIAKQGTMTGQLKDQNVELSKQKELLGKFILPIWQGLQIIGLKALNALTQGLTILTIKMFEFVGDIVARIQAAGDLIQAWQDIGYKGLKEQYGSPKEAYDQFFSQRQAEMIPVVSDALMELANAGQEMGDDFSAGLNKAGDAAAEFENKVTAAMDKATMSINKALDDYNKKREKIERDLERRLDDITQDFQRRRERAALGLQQSLEDIDQDAQQRRADQTRDFYLEEQRALEDHKLDMARLESKYIMDLEDAVRERDARGVLELRRRYNIERKQREEDFNLNNKRRKEDFNLELAEIERQRLIRQQKEIEDFNLEMAQLAEQEELRKRHTREAAQDRLNDLEAAHRDKMMALGRQITEELKLTDAGLKALYDRLVAAYGPQGWVVSLIEGAYNYLAQASSGLTRGQQADAARYTGLAGAYASGAVSGTTYAASTNRTPTTGVQQYQRGGTFFATSPKLIQVGETPERVDITRLNAATGRPREGRGAGGGGRIGIDLNVNMEHGLMAEIADQTMDDVAEVFLNISNGGRGSRGSR